MMGRGPHTGDLDPFAAAFQAELARCAADGRFVGFRPLQPPGVALSLRRAPSYIPFVILATILHAACDGGV